MLKRKGLLIALVALQTIFKGSKVFLLLSKNASTFFIFFNTLKNSFMLFISITKFAFILSATFNSLFHLPVGYTAQT